MDEPDMEAIENMTCPACNKRAGDHSRSEHRTCAVKLLQIMGIVPDEINPEQVEIMTSDDMEMDSASSEILNMAKKHSQAGRTPSGKAQSQAELQHMLQLLLEEKFPNRPDTEDFWTMNQIIANLDTKSEEIDDPQDYFAYLARNTDQASALYVGMTRANSALVEGISGMRHASHLLALLHAVWMDGFAVGQELQITKQ